MAVTWHTTTPYMNIFPIIYLVPRIIPSWFYNTVWVLWYNAQTHSFKAFYKPRLPEWFWRERAGFQRSAFGWSTVGNDVVATIFISARIKPLIKESCLERPITFPDPVRYFGAPWRSFWILQVVRHCRRWASALFDARLVFCPHVIKL